MPESEEGTARALSGDRTRGVDRAPRPPRLTPGRRVLLVGHGDRHAISGHHHCLPICIDDVRRGRVHTLDRDPRCGPTFVADAASAVASTLLPREHYDSVVTMHLPYLAWLVAPVRGKRKRSEACLLRQRFFRNLHGAMADGGELVMELPATALSILDPLGSENRCGTVSRLVAAGARAPDGTRRLFEVASVGSDHCVFKKI